MALASRRREILGGAALILAAALVGGWSYRGFIGASEVPPTRLTTTTSSAPPVTAPPDLGQLALYIDEHFAEAEWYPSILRYEPLGANGVALVTTLSEASDGQAISICRAVAFWRPGDDLPILVRGVGDRAMADSASGAAEECRGGRPEA